MIVERFKSLDGISGGFGANETYKDLQSGFSTTFGNRSCSNENLPVSDSIRKHIDCENKKVKDKDFLKNQRNNFENIK
jgi:hypothetical protein